MNSAIAVSETSELKHNGIIVYALTDPTDDDTSAITQVRAIAALERLEVVAAEHQCEVGHTNSGIPSIIFTRFFGVRQERRPSYEPSSTRTLGSAVLGSCSAC
eukprot:TRINITY_DN361_c1_g1_i2.p1 TRINITY_DN361_c1_g1~~TRINITY_DN361_c1_g1_i2.p1  ORF type:complete len:103 (-),score=2.13 TRINITY_DN361_c1_g1_i2:264-572(-)